MHRTITARRVTAAVNRSMRDLSSPGFCTACGVSQRNVEPDARERECTACHEPAVYGAEELMLMLLA